MLRRSIIALAAIAALSTTMPEGAFAAGRGGHVAGGHFSGGGGHFAGGHFGGGHFAGGGRFIGGRGFHGGYGRGYYGGGGYYYGGYPGGYGYYEPDYGAAAALGVMSIISGIMASHLYYHHRCWRHHGHRVCR
jgi:hypothetical protein